MASILFGNRGFALLFVALVILFVFLLSWAWEKHRSRKAERRAYERYVESGKYEL